MLFLVPGIGYWVSGTADAADCRCQLPLPTAIANCRCQLPLPTATLLRASVVNQKK